MSEFQVGADDKARALRHFQSQSHAYNQVVERGGLRYLRTRERRALLEVAELGDPAIRTMIDVGTGGGVYALAAKAAGLRVTAVDLSPGMIANLQGKVDVALVGDVDSLQVATQHDVVVCAGALDFVVDPATAFRNLCRLVSPAGRLIVEVPRASLGGYLYALGVRTYLGFRSNLFSVRWLTREAARHGLDYVCSRQPLPWNLVARFRRPEKLILDHASS